MRAWLITFFICALAIVLAIKFVDLPVARFVHMSGWQGRLHFSAFGAPVLVGLSGLVLVGLAVQRALGNPIARWEDTGLLMALSLAWGVSVTEFALKPLFGRSMPSAFLASGHSGFHWFQGSPMDSFPSGHAVQIAAVVMVLCIAYPRWRALWCTIALLGSLVLVGGGWHFVSDVIAGNFVGAFGAAVIVMLWRTHHSYHS